MEEEEERGRGMKAPRGREVASAGSPRGRGVKKAARSCTARWLLLGNKAGDKGI